MRVLFPPTNIRALIGGMTILEIIKEFGSKEKYLEAVKELEIELYKNFA